MRPAQSGASERGKSTRSALDIILLLGASILVITLLMAGFLLSEKLKFGQFWVWGTMMGPVTFFPFTRGLRSIWRQRGFVYYYVGWFAVHVGVVYAAAARLPILIALVPVAVELFLGFTLAYWLFAKPPERTGR